MAIDVLSLWDFSNPELSETRFREKLSGANREDQQILLTQIARSLGLRQNFTGAQEILGGIEPFLASSSEEVKVRFHLESGRAVCSPAHPPESQNREAQEVGARHYLSAFELGSKTGLDYLAVDALHMMAMVDTEPTKQLEWDQKALDFMLASSQPEARKWEPSLRHNIGYALGLASRYEEALQQYEIALNLRKESGNARQIKVGRWMFARTLRSLSRFQEALDIQLELEQSPEPGPFVYEELSELYRALGDPSKADFYFNMAKSLGR